MKVFFIAYYLKFGLLIHLPAALIGTLEKYTIQCTILGPVKIAIIKAGIEIFRVPVEGIFFAN